MIKLLHADNFYTKEETEKLFKVISKFPFVEKQHGFEVDNFNYTIPGLDPIFSKFVGEEVIVDEENSGIFRKPRLGIHFESFQTPNDWLFILALEPTTLTLYYHETGAKSALDGYKFNYMNLFEWEDRANILLEPNEGVIFRPWLFHSLINERMVQIYRLKGKENG